MTESVHVTNGRIGALERWAGTTKAERARGTEAAREGWLLKLADQADPDGRLSDEERMAAAEALRKAHMLRLARRSAAARAGGRSESPRKSARK